MIPEIRNRYNKLFTEEKYNAFINDLESVYPGHLEFRVAETPIFVPEEFTNKMVDACEAIIEVISTNEYSTKSEKAIPSHLKVPGEDKHPQCIAFDFGVCVNEKGEYEPQLIEMQGFPSLFAWEVKLPQVYARHFWWPEHFTIYLNGFTDDTYIDLLRKIIIEDCPVENVILLEILPHQQKTRVDFYATEELLGIKIVCLTEIIKEGKDLFYMNKGRKIQIKRIYNRVIFDDLQRQSKEIQEKGKIFQQELNVTWIPHPNWFYKLSKFTLPFISNKYVPETHFLNEISIPDDLENYVIKPLFSFAGQGVIIDVSKKDIEAIKDKENWIIQRKVNYANAIITPDIPAKAEIRLFYLWPPDSPKPIGTNNLSRLSKGKMIGVRYNKDKDWVGGSFCLFEKK